MLEKLGIDARMCERESLSRLSRRAASDQEPMKQ